MFRIERIGKNWVTGASIAVGIMLSACGHMTMRDKVVMKTSDDRAYVCMNDGEVKVGDEVILYTTQCTSAVSGDGSQECKATKTAEGTVSKLINQHYSEVMITDGGSFSEGTRVVRKNEFKAKYKAFLKRIN